VYPALIYAELGRMTEAIAEDPLQGKKLVGQAALHLILDTDELGTRFKKGMIGLAVTNARPSIPPTFSVEPMLGTNPLTIGAPTDEEFPFLIDCATSAIQRGKVEYYNRVGKDVQKGVDCEILKLKKGYKILTTDFERIFEERITNVSRHKAFEYDVKILLHNGKEVVVTPDHPC